MVEASVVVKQAEDSSGFRIIPAALGAMYKDRPNLLREASPEYQPKILGTEPQALNPKLAPKPEATP